jgi:hypothetical protein
LLISQRGLGCMKLEFFIVDLYVSQARDDVQRIFGALAVPVPKFSVFALGCVGNRLRRKSRPRRRW